MCLLWPSLPFGFPSWLLGQNRLCHWAARRPRQAPSSPLDLHFLSCTVRAGEEGIPDGKPMAILLVCRLSQLTLLMGNPAHSQEAWPQSWNALNRLSSHYPLTATDLWDATLMLWGSQNLSDSNSCSSMNCRKCIHQQVSKCWLFPLLLRFSLYGLGFKRNMDCWDVWGQFYKRYVLAKSYLNNN